MSKLGCHIRNELGKLCNQSLLGSLEIQDLKNFQWSKVFDEIRQIAPIFCNFLISATTTRTTHKHRIPVICFSTAILLKYRCEKMSLLQKMISLVLKAGHCSKMYHVYIIITSITCFVRCIHDSILLDSVSVTQL
jgi:hypothetical protein